MIAEYTILITLAFHHLVIGGVLIISLWLLTKRMSLSAEARSWLWMIAFVLTTLLPFTLISFDTTQLTILEAGNVILPSDKPDQSLLAAKLETPETKDKWHFPSQLVFQFSSILTLSIVIWLIGSVWRAAIAINTLIRTKQLVKSKLEVIPHLSNAAHTPIYSSALIASPLVIGLFRSKIILPQSIVTQLSDNQLMAIVLHEQAHIKRGDNCFALFQEVVAILFWWSPIVRFINQRIHFEREIACDLRAANQLNNNKQYAQSLLDCAKLMVNEQRSILAMELFSKKKELSYRVGAVLENRPGKLPNTFLILVSCLLLSVTTVQAAHYFAPSISVKHSIDDARAFSFLSAAKSEALLDAVKQNRVDQIQELLNSGLDINRPVIRDGTALMIAVKRGDKGMVQTLIDLGANVNQASIYDGNPLIIAAKTNNIELAELLLDQGADVNSIVPFDETPLINASRFGHFEMTKLLIDRGADVNLSVKTSARDGYQNRSPLNMARQQSIRDLLISYDALE